MKIEKPLQSLHGRIGFFKLCVTGTKLFVLFTELRQCFLVCRQVHKDIADSLERSGYRRADNANGHGDGIKAPTDHRNRSRLTKTYPYRQKHGR